MIIQKIGIYNTYDICKDVYIYYIINACPCTENRTHVKEDRLYGQHDFALNPARPQVETHQRPVGAAQKPVVRTGLGAAVDVVGWRQRHGGQRLQAGQPEHQGPVLIANALGVGQEHVQPAGWISRGEVRHIQ